MDKSYSDLKKIAVDLAENKIFSNLHVNTKYNNLITVFMPLVFLNEEQRKELDAKKVVFIYEYYSDAGPRGINGMPSFFSMRFLNEDEYQTMWQEYIKYVKIKEEFLNDYDPTIPVDVGNGFLSKEDLKK